MKNKDQIINTAKVIVLATILTVGMQYVAAQTSWTAPVASPPQQNTYAPLNVGETMQIKNGGLTVAAAAVSGSGLAVLNGSTILDSLRFVSTGSGASTVNYIQSGAGRTTDTWAPLKFGIYGSTNSKMVIDANGNLGVGSNIVPTAKLDVDGAVRIRGGGTPSAGMVLTATDNLGNATWQAPAATGVSMPTGSANQTLRHTGSAWQASPTLINTGTNIGIGVSNPAAKLDVGGTIKISGGNPGAGKVLTSDANGLASWSTNNHSTTCSSSPCTLSGLVPGKTYLVIVYGAGTNSFGDSDSYTLSATANSVTASISIGNHPDGTPPVTIPVVTAADGSGVISVTTTNFNNGRPNGFAVSG